MLTPEEEKFVDYWQEQRTKKKRFLRNFSIGMPLGVLMAVLLLVNLMSGWYVKATSELNRNGSLLVVILVATVGIVVFMTIFAAHHRWDRNEATYQELLQRKEAAISTQTDS